MSSKIKGNNSIFLRRSFFPFNALGMPSFNNSVENINSFQWTIVQFYNSLKDFHQRSKDFHQRSCYATKEHSKLVRRVFKQSIFPLCQLTQWGFKMLLWGSGSTWDLSSFRDNSTLIMWLSNFQIMILSLFNFNHCAFAPTHCYGPRVVSPSCQCPLVTQAGQ